MGREKLRTGDAAALVSRLPLYLDRLEAGVSPTALRGHPGSDRDDMSALLYDD